ncbi:hypothetical protein IAQ61_010638 [Plenodomus lingam]|uniref:uncharacterized protein n=1 Tax=Leptosphaeria maculans TaxID=5022 RepID=UPI00332ECD1B|nr:hypothetical protein IAQ61_010638 [Plenodomus lingam]
MALNDYDFPPLPPREHAQFTRRNFAALTTDHAKRMLPTRSSAMIVTLYDLPDELILEIIKYLTPVDLRKSHLRTLINLARTNRRLHGLVTPEIFRRYHNSFGEPYLFLRTIISNPSLAELVHSVDIIYGSWVRRNRIKYKPNAQDKKIVKEGIRALGLPDWKG